MNILLIVGIFVLVVVGAMFRRAYHYPGIPDKDGQLVTFAEEWKVMTMSGRQIAWWVLCLAVVTMSLPLLYLNDYTRRQQSRSDVSR
jgi:hypothetical protein